ncbi:MAG: DNA polymerase III subunit gamma/tau [bacterium]
MSFYLKYRPQTIDELDLSLVRETLGQIIKLNKLSHAYLFTGPRGAGKTSSARILARVANCDNNKEKFAEPCNQCPACLEILGGGALDVIEIDAASNRGIDDMRELKEKIRLAPSSLRYKVYIIDEVHMLTTEAFNALLKTLEEPPAHTLFILCTTELHKIPETIVSRCVRVNFYKASADELVRSFARVLLSEGIVLSDQILLYLATHVDGSFRDGVKILEQILGYGSDVTLSQVESILSGGVGYDSNQWVEVMLVKDTSLALQFLNQAVKGGVDLTFFLVAAMQTLRSGLLAPYKLAESNLSVPAEIGIKLVYALDKTARMLVASPIPELLVETMIIEWCAESVGNVVKSTNKSSDESISSKISKPIKVEIVPIKTEEIEVEIVKDQIMDGATMRSLWRKMLSGMDKSLYSLEALLSKASPMRISGKNLVIGVAYDFHKAQLETSRFRDIVEKLVKDAYGMPLTVAFEVVKGSDTIKQAPVDSDLMEAAEEIFAN